MVRQIVVVWIGDKTSGKALTYVWKGETPLAVGDTVRVRNPRSAERETRPLVEGVVIKLDSDYQGYLVKIHSRVIPRMAQLIYEGE